MFTAVCQACPCGAAGLCSILFCVPGALSALSLQSLLPSPSDRLWGVCREQERIQKSEQARRETERILWEQQQEVDRKKAEMQRRDVEREKVSPPGAICLNTI